MNQAELVQRLAARLTAGGRPPHIAQTHLSYVILTADRAYKIKKAIDLGFADFRALETRRLMCEREVQLNRRLAPDVYLGFEAIGLVGQEPLLGGLAAPIEYCVVMKRLDESRSLAGRVAAGTVGPDDLTRVARRLAEFHDSAPAVERSRELGGRAVLLANHLQNVRQLRPFVGGTITPDQLQEVRSGMSRFLRRARAVFRERAAAGRIRDCHGDVRAEHVFIDGAVTIIDCIEFEDRFRFIDVAAEIAFLAVDLEALGRPDLGQIFLAAYAAASGDDGLWRVLPFYLSYRATVRAKVLAMRAAQSEVPAAERALAAAQARRFAELAARYSPRA